MFTAKISLTLLALAASGFMNSQTGNVATPAPDRQPATQVIATAAAPSQNTLQAAAQASVLASVRSDLQDASAKISLQPLSISRRHGAIELRGSGEVQFDHAGSLPIEVLATYDPQSSRMEQVNYRVTGNARPSRPEQLGKTLRQSIADRIGARLVLEFSQQPVDFALLGIDEVTSGRRKVVLSGTGITRFEGEGSAFTQFVATADKFTGKVLTVQYELRQEVDALEIASTN